MSKRTDPINNIKFDFVNIRKNLWENRMLILSSVCLGLLIFSIIKIINSLTPPPAPINIPEKPIENPTSSGECGNCEFAEAMKDYENIKCNPTEQQLGVIKNMTPEMIKYCGDNICLDQMEDLLMACYADGKFYCTDCEFKNLIDQDCIINSYDNIENDYDTDVTRFQKRIGITQNCGCIPTDTQISVMDNLIKNNNTENYLTNCRYNSCNLIKPLEEGCLKNLGIECQDCEVFLNMMGNCMNNINIDVEMFDKMSDYNKKLNVVENCGCIPTNSQLNVLREVNKEGVNFSTCANEPYCTSTIAWKDKCINPDYTPPGDYTFEEPDGFIYPAECEDCDFINKVETCVADGIDASEGEDSYSFYISGSCGCKPTSSQLSAIKTIINNNKNLETCVSNRCDELITMIDQCG